MFDVASSSLEQEKKITLGTYVSIINVHNCSCPSILLMSGR